MAVDRERIEAFRSYVDRGLGIQETFVQPLIGGGRTIGVLSTPLDSSPLGGWVICHSFGLEQVYLQSLESALARRLATTGFAVLRFHGRGYGDSELGAEHISMRSHVDDAQDAARVLAEATGVGRIGFAGVRLGGTVAVLAADLAGAAGLVAVAPALDGEGYVQWIAKQARLTGLATGEEVLPSAPLAELMSKGTLDVQGFPLRWEVYQEILGLDLVERIHRFRGDALLLQVSRGSEAVPGLRRLHERLRGLGAASDLEVLADPAAVRLGFPRYRRSKQGRKEDTQGDLTERVIAIVSAWCRDRRWTEADVRSWAE